MDGVSFESFRVGTPHMLLDVLPCGAEVCLQHAQPRECCPGQGRGSQWVGGSRFLQAQCDSSILPWAEAEAVVSWELAVGRHISTWRTSSVCRSPGASVVLFSESKRPQRSWDVDGACGQGPQDCLQVAKHPVPNWHFLVTLAWLRAPHIRAAGPS